MRQRATTGTRTEEKSLEKRAEQTTKDLDTLQRQAVAEESIRIQVPENRSFSCHTHVLIQVLMSMGEHDLTNVIFDRAAPCGAVLTSATDALEGGADATAVVCLVRETINGRNGTDEAALFKGQGSPGTTFNATRALCTVLDWKADESKRFTNKSFMPAKWTVTQQACICGQRASHTTPHEALTVPIKDTHYGVKNSIDDLGKGRSGKRRCKTCPEEDSGSTRGQRECIYAPDVLIFEVVKKYEQSYVLEGEISINGTAGDKVLTLSCIVLFREGARGGVGHYQIIRKVDNQWFLFDDCSPERVAGKWSRQTDNARTPTLPDIAKDLRCRDFCLESLVYLNPKGPTAAAGGATDTGEPVAATKKGVGCPRPEVAAAATSSEGEPRTTPAGNPQRKRFSSDGHQNAQGQPQPKQQARGEVQVVHRKYKGPAKIGRDPEPKARTEEGDELEEDPTKGETVGAQWADGKHSRRRGDYQWAQNARGRSGGRNGSRTTNGSDGTSC